MLLIKLLFVSGMPHIDTEIVRNHYLRHLKDIMQMYAFYVWWLEKSKFIKVYVISFRLLKLTIKLKKAC